MGPTHNNQNGPGGPKKGGLVKITTPGLVVFCTDSLTILFALKMAATGAIEIKI